MPLQEDSMLKLYTETWDKACYKITQYSFDASTGYLNHDKENDLLFSFFYWPYLT